MLNVLTKGFAVAAAVAFSFSASAQDVQAPTGTYVNDKGHTSLLWELDHMGLSAYHARVNDPEITLMFDAENVENSSVRAVINPANVDTGYSGGKDFNAEIANQGNILNAGEFPQIVFESTSVTKTGDTTATIEGNLMMLGQTVPVTLEAEYYGSMASHPFVKVPAIGFSAEGSFDRTAFGLDFLSGQGVGDMVGIEVNAEFIKQ